MENSAQKTANPKEESGGDGPSPSLIPMIEMNGIAVGSMRDLNTAIVENVDWTVSAEDYWIIGGLQGSGKTDFVSMTGGLMPPLRGSYRLMGEEMPIFDETRLKHRLRMGLVFETGQLFNHLTVRENVGLPLRYHRNLSKLEAAERVNQILEALDLGSWADSTPGAIGRNWQKRVGLARALILEPELLLLDNPLTGLDLRHVNWWLGFLRELSQGAALLQGRRMTLVVTSADLRPWRGQAQRFAILRQKRFVVLGTWDQLESASSELLEELVAIEQQK